jgi:uncharacterized protein YdeI (YjbR/CyaY-like superfamily)
MGKKDSRVDAYIDKAAPFARPILKHLRRVVHAGCPQVEETMKWSMPHFDYKGILCGMAAFKQHCAFGFWKQKLIFKGDKKKMDEAMGHFGCIKSLKDLPGERTLAGYVRKAAELNEKGIKDPREEKPPKGRPRVPSYLSAALKKHAKARRTFENFSPSHQREYVEWLTEAKREETRQRRLKTAIEWLAQGKPHHWKYL